MSKMKKILCTLLVLAMAFSMVAMLGGCGKEGGSTEDTGVSGESGTYTVSVKTQGGMPMAGLDVYVYADDTLGDLKQAGQTKEDGTVSFTMPKSSKYAVAVSGAPKGYTVEKSYSFSGNAADITLSSSLIKGENLSGATLGLGDVMYDFSVVTPAGETVVLSEMLAQKDVVLLNFWYTTCTYCVAEFPFMEQAYQTYQEDVGIIALNPFEDGNAISSFQAQYGLSFTMAQCQPAWATTFGVSGYPTTVAVDRYGVICMIEAGGITSLRPFTCMFDHFTGDDYEQKLCTNGLADLITNVKPSYEQPTAEELTDALNVGDMEVTFRGEEDDEYCWPFIVTEKDGEKCIKASNSGIEDSYAILYADVTLKAGQAVGFDFLRSTQTNSDVMYVIVDDQDINSISGYFETERWETCYPWVAEKDGTYEVALCYLKDSDGNVGDDTIYVKNLRVVDSADIETATYIPREAASTEDGFEYTYADIVLNQKDGYYHVGSANGPLLLADMMNYTQFSEEDTLWSIVYDGQLKLDGELLYDKMVDYFSYSSNSKLNGVCTVTEELAGYLKEVAKQAGFTDDENEWLLMCKYFETYGSDQQLEDPIKGLAPFSAYEAKLGSGNSFTYHTIIMPRGYLARFVPSKSGVYRITSSNDSPDGVEGWIFNGNREELYVYEQSERMYNDSNNVSMVYYMEAGEEYYIDIAYWDYYYAGTIDYTIEYVGKTFDLFKLCSPGYFTYDSDATGDAMYYTISGGIKAVLKSDGYYYHDLGKDANGKQLYGSKIYADFSGITGLFGQPIATVNAYNEDGTVQKDENGNVVKVEGMIDLGGFDFSKNEYDQEIISYLKNNDNDPVKTEEYLKALWGEDFETYKEAYQIEDVFNGIYHGEGEDLTDEITPYLSKMITSGKEELRGCVPVDEKLAQLLQKLLDKYTFAGVDQSWLKLCYYYEYLGK